VDAEALRRLVARAPLLPGVYRMLDADGRVLYVGKADRLRQRLRSYAAFERLGPRIRRLLEQASDIEITVTASSAEALLLESNLIKHHRPRYNVIFRDDKSYPYIRLVDTLGFPRFVLYRGRRPSGRCFGPYPNPTAVRETLQQISRFFRLRNCNDRFFTNRKRPCIQYEIGHCSAPCVGRVDGEEYALAVAQALRFLEGRAHDVIDALNAEMNAAAARYDFEKAAEIRDRILQIRQIQTHQIVSRSGGDLDVVALAERPPLRVAAVMRVRAGRTLGTWSYPARGGLDETAEEALVSFLLQHYTGGDVPPEIVLDRPLPDPRAVTEVLGRGRGTAPALTLGRRGDRRRWVAMVEDNARHALAMRHAGEALYRGLLEELTRFVNAPHPLQRVACFDVSHTMGEATVASCVVAGPEGLLKNAYRRYNIRTSGPGDDYHALEEALRRALRPRGKRQGEEDDRTGGEDERPDLLLIDGGLRQRDVARRVLSELALEGRIALLAIAKGPARKPGEEKIYGTAHDAPLVLDPHAPLFHFLQRLRDEAHRFAIRGHRLRLRRRVGGSALEGIPGLGPKRRRQLLVHFGGLQDLARAGVEDIARVPGIHRTLAERVYRSLHDEPAA
jgi:excinuclease ABC subunit C